jgi:hypothetical protein
MRALVSGAQNRFSFAVISGGVLGGVLAATLLNQIRLMPGLPLTMLLLVGGVLVSVLTVALPTIRAHPDVASGWSRLTRERLLTEKSRSASEAGLPDADVQPSTAPANQVTVVQPSENVTVATPSWWQHEPGTNVPQAGRHAKEAAVSPRESRNSQAVDSHPILSQYQANVRVPQCPRCGELRVLVHQRPQEFRFHCERSECQYEWSWQPESPWPRTTLRPARRQVPVRPDSQHTPLDRQ